MAEFRTWERQVLPEGKLAMPTAAPSLIESFGQGMVSMASAAGRAAETVRKTDEWRKQKEWEIVGQPKAAALVSQIQVEYAEKLPELEAKAAAGLADLPDKINEAIIDATEAALKGNPDPLLQHYVRTRMDDFRADAVTSGIKQRATARIVQDAHELQNVVNRQAGLAEKDFSQYDRAATLIDDMINGNQRFSADKKTELSRISKRQVLEVALAGLRKRDPDAALNELNSGRYDDLLDEADKQNLIESITRGKEISELKATLDRNQADQKFTSDTLAEFESAVRKAEEDGTYEPPSLSKLTRALGSEKAAREATADLASAADTASDLIKVKSQSLAEDLALQDSLQMAVDALKDDDPSKSRLDRRLTLVSIAIAKKKAKVESDPGGYAREINSDVAAAWDDVLASNADAGTVSKALVVTKQELRRLGVTAEFMRPIPRKISNTLMDGLKRNGTAENIAYFQHVFGKDYSHFLAAVLPTIDPYLGTALIMDQPHQQKTQDILLGLSRDPDAFFNLNTNAKLTIAQNDALQTALFKNLRDFQSSYADQAGGASISANFGDAAHALALHHVYNDRMSPAEAAALAVREIGADDYTFKQFHGHVYRIPRGYSDSTIRMGANEYLDQLAKVKLDRPTDAPTMSNASLVGGLKAAGLWVTAPDESGLELRFDTTTPATINGKPITLTWAELDRLGMQRLKRPPSRAPRATGTIPQ